MKPLTPQQREHAIQAAALGAVLAKKAHDNQFVARLEDVQFLLDAGTPPAQVARKLGVAPASLARQLYRRGHADLARLFGRKAAA